MTTAEDEQAGPVKTGREIDHVVACRAGEDRQPEQQDVELRERADRDAPVQGHPDPAIHARRRALKEPPPDQAPTAMTPTYPSVEGTSRT